MQIVYAHIYISYILSVDECDATNLSNYKYALTLPLSMQCCSNLSRWLPLSSLVIY